MGTADEGRRPPGKVGNLTRRSVVPWTTSRVEVSRDFALRSESLPWGGINSQNEHQENPEGVAGSKFCWSSCEQRFYTVLKIILQDKLTPSYGYTLRGPLYPFIRGHDDPVWLEYNVVEVGKSSRGTVIRGRSSINIINDERESIRQDLADELRILATLGS